MLSEKLFKEKSQMTSEQFAALAKRYTDTVFRVAYNYIKSQHDAEDVTQNVFEKLRKVKASFETEEHARSWLIRVTINECKNLVRSKWWRMESYEDYASTMTFENPAHSDLHDAVMELPKKYRISIYLHYFEGKSTEQIASLLRIPKNTVCSHLKRGRELLKQKLQEAEHDD